MDELMALVKREVKAREISGLVKSNSSRFPTRNHSSFPPSASSLLTSGPSIKCVYCGEGHYLASCSKFRTPQECKEMLLRAGPYFNCLITNHKVRECGSTKTCRHCKRKYHQSICDRLNLSVLIPSGVPNLLAMSPSVKLLLLLIAPALL